MYPPIDVADIELPVAMNWRSVLFANWPVDPEVVDAHLPSALTVDTYEGDAWLSVVPFRNVNVRPQGLPGGLGQDLPELNLRTYVTYEGRPGVYFFSLDADGVLGVLGARLAHYLPYYFADMDLQQQGDRLRFQSRRRHPGERPCDFDATYGPVGEEYEPEPGSLEAFLTENYRYYTESPGGELRYANVEHERWPLYDAEVEFRENEVFETNGFAHPDSDPLFLYSPGVDVTATGSRAVESQT